MNNDVEIVTCGIDDIALIKPLWEGLNSIHADVSPYFSDRFAGMTFERRIVSLVEKSQSGKLRIDLVRDKKSAEYAGYCVSSCVGAHGEIESIFLDAPYRKHGLGDLLVDKALAWMNDAGCTEISVDVIFGNEATFPFYARHGFYPRNVILYRKPD